MVQRQLDSEAATGHQASWLLGFGAEQGGAEGPRGRPSVPRGFPESLWNLPWDTGQVTGPLCPQDEVGGSVALTSWGFRRSGGRTPWASLASGAGRGAPGRTPRALGPRTWLRLRWQQGSWRLRRQPEATEWGCFTPGWPSCPAELAQRERVAHETPAHDMRLATRTWLRGLVLALCLRDSPSPQREATRAWARVAPRALPTLGRASPWAPSSHFPSAPVPGASLSPELSTARWGQSGTVDAPCGRALSVEEQVIHNQFFSRYLGPTHRHGRAHGRGHARAGAVEEPPGHLAGGVARLRAICSR